ncbi:ATPase [Streptomyces sp. PTM05]|uniref:ATPase n=1 Tax=Streptantibioticus parmotrematis TaxID=2873249 RepID=A0ABS7QQY2_9ACTN|nr:BadF/BadG/BcrA/BcrD ATPase family protein [Streptantibioticus parmotrematis]MBY8885597.1 ATPase [Streptantibioticus parmotrematis]
MTGRPGPASGWVLGVDSGGSGLRCALARADGAAPVLERAGARPVPTGPRGIDAAAFLAELLPLVGGLTAEAGAGEVVAACVGAAGMASLGDELRERLPEALRSAIGTRRLALAADAVTAYAGALGMRPGAVVAAGTGLIALGTALDGTGWRRADGWGHLLGDCGGGAWIGRAGLESALRAYDGRPGGSALLLACLEAEFGPASHMPGQLYPRSDRPAVLASFAPRVAECAGRGDPVATGILREAARHIVEAAAAVRPADGDVALTGGLTRIGAPLLAPVRELAAQLLPDVRLVTARAGPLQGALRIAATLAEGGPALPEDPALLTVHRARA